MPPASSFLPLSLLLLAGCAFEEPLPVENGTGDLDSTGSEGSPPPEEDDPLRVPADTEFPNSAPPQNSLEDEQDDPAEQANDQANAEEEDNESASEEAAPAQSVLLRIGSLNIAGQDFMPWAASFYANTVQERSLDVLAIQGGENARLGQALPVDYTAAEQLKTSLGSCWERQYQVFFNTCNGVALISHERFDLSDGPELSRTGELAVVSKGGRALNVINVHWDDADDTVRVTNAAETVFELLATEGSASVVLGQLNASCTGSESELLTRDGQLKLLSNGGKQCLYASAVSGEGESFPAWPSPDEGVLAALSL